MANVGKSSKPFKRNQEIENAIAQATQYVGGVALFQVPSWVRPRVDAFVVSPKIKRDSMVCFACAFCKTGFGLCRFTELRDGDVKSCWCLEDKENRDYQARQVNKISARDLRKIYDDRTSIGITATLSKWGITKSTLDHACKDKYSRLTRKPINIQNEIYLLANVRGVKAAMAKFELNHAETMTICGIARKRKAAEKAEATAAWVAMPESRKSAIKTIIKEGRSMIRDAVEQATGGLEAQPWDWYEEGRYWGELTIGEYSTCGEYSYFGWAVDVVRALPEEFAASIFGSSVIQFIEVINQTESGRAGRRRRYKNRISSIDTPLVKRKRAPAAKMSGKYFFPPMGSQDIVAGISTYALAA
ncbi:hypothetical protein [Tunturiibacter psychrotolerans]|uniref:hypothetical protein n=1 Tax=Tunturiibacter psychrotolerans TaxID=3069686 RepID=UPI003D194386